MDQQTASFSRQDLAAAMDWWREAGVDHGFAEEAQVMLGAETSPLQERPKAEQRNASPPPAEAAAPPAPELQLGGDPAAWPKDLEAFRQWWLEEPSLDNGGTHPRIPGHGPQGAETMIIVPMPEAADKQSLLSGPEGAFLGSVMAAMGLEAGKTCIASAMPRHTPHADLATSGLGPVLRHHIALAKPARIIAFGRGLAPLMEGTELPTLTTYTLAALHQRPAFRAGFWRKWLDFSGETPA
ncbi:hypothetical protein [Paraurantiacibacter namhicola]|uniref:Uracil DNA glycosylase superfamily protein n=1 Tax=Paraurantiacibacter namhicola TaxID=645517 RepID=A0A1C7DA16_9SPHN|nr:hypothetical protein [Paraurantiacibacter namhicola]ANU08153.1 hypothetical protein A6F65_01858 [Paraurantiacibacter namhicola]